MKNPIHLILLLLAMVPIQGFGQPPSILDGYIQQGLEQNLALKRQEISYDRSIAALREAKGLFFPQISFQANYTLAGGGRTLDFPVGDLLNPVYATLNSLTESNSFPTDIENVNEQFLPNNFHETRLRLVQPIFNTDIYYNRKAQQALSGMSESQKEAYRNSLIRDIRVAYFQYLQSLEAIEIYDQAGELLNELLRTNQSLVANDKATPEVITQAEFQISQWTADHTSAIQQAQQARSYFNFLLNRPLTSPIEIDENLVAQPEASGLTAWQAEGRQNRYELQQLDRAQQAAGAQVDMQRLQALPTVNAVVDLGFQGFGYTFDENQDYWLAQVSLNWNLFSGMQRQARLDQAKLQQRDLSLQQQALQQQIDLQIQTAFDQVQQGQLALEAAKQGQMSAGKSFRILNRKYEAQQASWLEVTQARTELTQAQLQQNVAQYELLRRIALLNFASGKRF